MVSTGIDPQTVGLEVRIGHLARESAQTKSRRYLVEGRCILRHVDADRVLAKVRGRQVYDVAHQVALDGVAHALHGPAAALMCSP